ncbi:MAG: nuclear transport factor 2 family protein [bacterium]
MKKILSSLIVMLTLASRLGADTAPDAPELTRLLTEFLAGASRNDATVHDRFWAPDLIYTGSSGRRIGKADIMKDVSAPAPTPPPTEPKTVFTAEDVRIQQYGNTAVVAFRLVGTTEAAGKPTVSRYLNSGTFLKRDGKWQAVNWQATRMPRPEEESREAVTALEAALHRAILAADVKALELLLAEGFVWTHRDGQPMTRKDLIGELASGQLKYAKLETAKVTVSVHGDTAIVRGESLRQRSAFKGKDGPSSDATPFTVFYTLTLAHDGSGWQGVALHTSRAQ